MVGDLLPAGSGRAPELHDLGHPTAPAELSTALHALRLLTGVR